MVSDSEDGSSGMTTRQSSARASEAAALERRLRDLLVSDEGSEILRRVLREHESSVERSAGGSREEFERRRKTTLSAQKLLSGRWSGEALDGSDPLKLELLLKKLRRDLRDVRKNFADEDRAIVDEVAVATVGRNFRGVVHTTVEAALQHGEENPEKILDLVKESHGMSGIELARRLLNLKKGDGESLGDFIDRASGHLSFIESWPEDLKCGLLLNAVEEETARMVVNASPKDIAEVILLLNKQASLDKRKKKKEGNGPRKETKGPKKEAAQEQKYAGPKCFNCGQRGHRLADCKNDPVCYNCRESGHIASDCPEPPRKKEVRRVGSGGPYFEVMKKTEGGDALRLVLDCGADYGLARGEAGANLLKLRGVKVEVCQEEIVFGVPMVAERKATVTFQDGTKEKFLVIEGGPSELLLSAPYMEENINVWKIKDRKIIWTSGEEGELLPRRKRSEQCVDTSSFVKEALSVELDETERALDGGRDDLHEEEEMELPEEFKRKKDALLEEFSDVFLEKGLPSPSKLPPVSLKVKEGSEPIVQASRRMDERKRAFFRKWVEDMLDKGLLKPSKSSYKFQPILIDQGKPGEYRVAFDFRPLNESLVIERTTFPVIAELIDSFAGVEVISVADLKSGYFQLRVTEETSKLLAIETPLGLMEFTVLPLGPAPAVDMFQREVKLVLPQGVDLYIDDLLVKTMSGGLDQHLEQLREVFEACRKYGLTLHRKKLKLFMRRVKYLGWMVSRDGVVPSKERVEALEGMQIPETPKRIRTWVGMLNGFKRFVPKLSQLTGPFRAVLDKGKKKVEITDEMRVAFEQIKRELKRVILKVHPDPRKYFVIATDASNLGIACQIQQVDSERDDMEVGEVVLVDSKGLSDAELNYAAVEKEALAVLYFVEKYHYLFGNKFTVITDCAALRYVFLGTGTQNKRLERWRLRLGSFIFVVKHRAGVDNIIPDYFSRIMIRRFAVVASTDQVQLLHSRLGHRGPDVMKRYASEVLGIGLRQTDVDAVYGNCRECQEANVSSCSPDRRGIEAPVVPDMPWEAVAIDYLCLPRTDDVGQVLVVIDLLSRFVFVFPTRTQTSEETVGILRDLFAVHGFPLVLLSDGGPAFAAALYKESLSRWSVEAKFITPYNPKANGVVERVNGTLLQMMRKMVDDVTDWVQVLPQVVGAYNACPHSGLGGKSPYLLFHGRNPRLFDLCVGNMVFHLEDLWNEAQRRTEEQREARLPSDDEQVPSTFQVGDLVMLRQNKKKTKLHRDFKGPYEVIKVTAVGYVIRAARGKERKVLQRNVKRYTGQERQLADLSPEFEAEKIVSHAVRVHHTSKEREIHFRVRWVGYEPNEDTFEPIEHVTAQLVDDYVSRVSAKTRASVQRWMDKLLH